MFIPGAPQTGFVPGLPVGSPMIGQPAQPVIQQEETLLIQV